MCVGGTTLMCRGRDIHVWVRQLGLILVYHCNKQDSNVILSIQFDTNVSELLRPVFPWSYEVMILFNLLVNCLRVVSIDRLYVCRVCFVCGSHQKCTDHYCVSPSSNWSCFQRTIFIKGFFFSKKWSYVRSDERLTSV